MPRLQAVSLSPYVEAAREIDGPGACGMLQPFKVSAFAAARWGSQPRHPRLPDHPRIDRWLDDVVQPAAQLYFGLPVRT